MKFFVIILALSLAGCGTLGTYSKLIDGKMVTVAQLKLNKNGSITVKDGEVEMEMDSREPNIWEKNVLPVFRGIARGTQANLGR